METLRIAPGIPNVASPSEHLPWPPRPGILLPPPSSLFVSFPFFSLHVTHSGLHSVPQACQPLPDLRASVLTIPSKTHFPQYSPRLTLSALGFNINATAPNRKATLTTPPYSDTFPTRNFLTHHPVCSLHYLYQNL